MTSSFDTMWAELEPVGRAPSGGYRRFAWSAEDAALREWFTAQAQARSMDVVRDRAGNLWAWAGDPDADGPGLVLGSHLDSVPDGGAFDGPLGVVSAFAALDAVRAAGPQLGRPLGIACFGDEEGARFGVACAGSRIITGALVPDRARALTDADGVTLGEAFAASGRSAGDLGVDAETLTRIGVFVELHVEQGRALGPLGSAVGVADAIWPHGRWRFDFAGEANHAGTTRLVDRRDPMLDLARTILMARDVAALHGGLATIGKVQVEPNGVNAIPSLVRAWLDARGPDEATVLGLVAELVRSAAEAGGQVAEESWTGATGFDPPLRDRMAGTLGDAPVLGTGAGHDAGILAAAGIRTGMLFVRNPTGVSHSPAEHADPDDCLAGVAALRAVLADLAA
jgi:beta-ureidopropionase / N-carbamoyl-L-amino-acid hydrolase